MLSQCLVKIETPTHDSDDDGLEKLFDNSFHDCASFHKPIARENRRWDGHKWDEGFKVEIPKFNGGLQAEEFLGWLSTVERILDIKDVLDDKKFKLVALSICMLGSTLDGKTTKRKKCVASLEKMK